MVKSSLVCLLLWILLCIIAIITAAHIFTNEKKAASAFVNFRSIDSAISSVDELNGNVSYDTWSIRKYRFTETQFITLCVFSWFLDAELGYHSIKRFRILPLKTLSRVNIQKSYRFKKNRSKCIMRIIFR